MTLSQQIIEVGWRLVEAHLTDERSGNISVRCPDGQTVLITPSGREYRLLMEDDLVCLDLKTGAAKGKWKPSSEWRLHLATYAARPDVNAVIHHHATWASAVAVARRTIPVLIDEAADIGPIPTAPYRPSASAELAEVVANELTRGTNAVLLANHGAIAVGRGLAEALRRAVEVERLAKIYIGAEVLGGAHALDDDEIARSQEFFRTYRAEEVEQRDRLPMPFVPRVTGAVGFHDLLDYSFRAGVTFATLTYAVISKKLGRSSHLEQTGGGVSP